MKKRERALITVKDETGRIVARVEWRFYSIWDINSFALKLTPYGCRSYYELLD